MEDFKQYLTDVMQYEATGNGKHEWIEINKARSVRIANYLRSHGYVVKFRPFKILSYTMYYIGVPAKTL